MKILGSIRQTKGFTDGIRGIEACDQGRGQQMSRRRHGADGILKHGGGVHIFVVKFSRADNRPVEIRVPQYLQQNMPSVMS